ADSPDRLQIRQNGSEEDIRSGLLKCLKTADGFVQARISEEEIVRSSGQHERKRQRASGFGSCGDSLYGEFEFIERLAGVSGSVFDRAANQSGVSGEANGFRNRFGAISESISQVRRDGHISCVDNCFAVAEGFGPGKR